MRIRGHGCGQPHAPRCTMCTARTARAAPSSSSAVYASRMLGGGRTPCSHSPASGTDLEELRLKIYGNASNSVVCVGGEGGDDQNSLNIVGGHVLSPIIVRQGCQILYNQSRLTRPERGGRILTGPGVPKEGETCAAAWGRGGFSFWAALNATTGPVLAHASVAVEGGCSGVPKSGRRSNIVAGSYQESCKPEVRTDCAFCQQQVQYEWDNIGDIGSIAGNEGLLRLRSSSPQPKPPPNGCHAPR